MKPQGSASPTRRTPGANRGKQTTAETNAAKRCLARARYLRVLSTALLSSCNGYHWQKTLLGYIRARDYARLYQWSDAATAVAWPTADEHYSANQIAALVIKYPWSWSEIGLDRSPEDNALRKYEEAETRCRRTNRRIRRLLRGGGYSRFLPLLEEMREWVHRVLGEHPDMTSIYNQCRFGTGASVGVHGKAQNLYRKLFASEWTVSPGCQEHARLALWSNDQIRLDFTVPMVSTPQNAVESFKTRVNNKLRLCDSDILQFVPKNAKAHRAISVPPTLSLFVQTGIDAVMRSALARWGYDLTDQTANQRWARVGSISGRFCTMDLSSASDSLALELVRYLLPEAWYALLNATRSPAYTLAGVSRRYEKFCGMGNGFCFPLETLVFAAACRAAMKYSLPEGVADRHCVYGDDIIVPTQAATLVRALLNFCGFKVNEDKTFTTGPFRESCGADWYEGQDVRPVYLDYPLTDDVSRRIFHNATLASPRSEIFFAEVRTEILSWCYEDGNRHPLVRPRRAAGERQTVTDYAAQWYELANLNGAYEVEQDVFLSSKWAKWSRAARPFPGIAWYGKDSYYSRLTSFGPEGEGNGRWVWREEQFTPLEDTIPDSYSKSLAQYLACLTGSPGGALTLRRETERRSVWKI